MEPAQTHGGTQLGGGEIEILARLQPFLGALFERDLMLFILRGRLHCTVDPLRVGML